MSRLFASVVKCVFGEGGIPSYGPFVSLSQSKTFNILGGGGGSEIVLVKVTNCVVAHLEAGHMMRFVENYQAGVLKGAAENSYGCSGFSPTTSYETRFLTTRDPDVPHVRYFSRLTDRSVHDAPLGFM